MDATKIFISFTPDDFPDFFDGWGDEQLMLTLKDGVRNGIARALIAAFGEQLGRVRIADHMHVMCTREGLPLGVTLKAIFEIGHFSASSIKTEFDLPKDVAVDGLNFECGGGARFERWFGDHDRSPTVKVKPMKRWNRVIVRFHMIDISASNLPLNRQVVEHCQCPGETLKPVPGALLHFECFVCARRYICECYRGIPERLATRENYDTKPYQDLLETIPYRKDTCHLCRGVPATTGNRQQGVSEVRAFYWRYLNDFAIGRDWSWRDAENHIRDRIGVPRIGEGWVAEANLLRIVQALYPSHEVLHQASPDWLGRQRFDIFISELKLAIEYNGEQHYFPIEHFGGQRGFERTQQRDAEKRQKAADAGITMIEFRYDEDLSAECIERRITGLLAERR